MASDAFISGLTFKIGDGAGSEVFTELEEVTSVSGLGKTNELVEVTHFGSGGVKEYIGGLADGQEITVECNYDADATQQAQVVTYVNSKTTGNVQVEITDGTATNTFDFAVTYLGWVLNPSVSDKNMISFTMKISGDITES